MTLAGRIVLVTGAGRGIGRAVSRRLAREGARLALVARTASDLERLAAELEADGTRALPIPADVAREAEVDAAVARVEAELGPVDLLVNNAGIPTRRPIRVADYDTPELQRILDVNLLGAFFAARAVLRVMRERRRGTLIHIGSISGERAAPDVLPYSLAKFGLEALNQTIIAENTALGIKSHLVVPGPTNSSIWDRKEVPLPADVRARMIEPEDVAEVVAFLAALPQRVRIDRIVVTPNHFPIKLWDYPLLDS
jgi:3-oxoacyl-[acyl-carrier protein] reductase